MVLDDLLDLGLDLWRHLTRSNFLQQGSLCRGQVRAELAFPAGDLVNRDRVKLSSMLSLEEIRNEMVDIQDR